MKAIVFTGLEDIPHDRYERNGEKHETRNHSRGAESLFASSHANEQTYSIEEHQGVCRDDRPRDLADLRPDGEVPRSRILVDLTKSQRERPID